MKSACACAIILCALAICALAQGDSDTTARSKVTALEQAWARAITTGDLRALDVLSDTGIIYVDADGNLISKSELLSTMKSAHPQRLITSLTKVQVFGDTAVVNGAYQSKEIKNGRIVVHDGQFTDTWLYRNSSWVCIAAQSTPLLSGTK